MSTKFFKDLTERVVSTYLQAFIGLLIAAWSPAIDLGSAKAAAIAAIPAALSVAKGLLAKLRGNQDDASMVDLDSVADYGVDNVE